MVKRLLADSIYIAVYEDKDGKECFATWGHYGERRIRWYKTRKEGERQVNEILTDTRPHKPPTNTRIVRFQMEVEVETEDE